MRRRNLPQSGALVATRSAKINLDIEKETGTGKTCVYIRTMFASGRHNPSTLHGRRWRWKAALGKYG